MTIIYTGRSVPLDGVRRLNAYESGQRAKAMSCVRSKSVQCQGQLYVSLFFDGTGNNERWVEEGSSQTQRERNKHSNVARLFEVHIKEPKNGYFAFYIPGVGTPFEDVGDDSKFIYDCFGMGMGYMGADRINYGIASILNAAHRYLIGNPLLPRNELHQLVNVISQGAFSPLSTEGALRWAALKTVEDRLAAIIRGQQRKLLEINVSIFGFSRGAAEARACAFWLSELCTRQGGEMTLAGVPLRIGFMGLFDTVAAVGVGDILPFTSGHMAWADGTQTIHPAVEECAHFIALHEQRASFPLEAAVGRGNIGYPGMHSDVGGGYCPGEQGKAMPEWGESPHLSQVPLIDMHFAAIKAGVPMMTIDEIRADPGVSKSFATDPKLLSTYNHWLEHQGIGTGDIREVTQAHARHYIRWRGLLHADGAPGVTGQDFFKRTPGARDRWELQDADDKLRLQLQFLHERREANRTRWGYAKERLQDAIFLASLTEGPVRVEPGKAPLSAEEDQFFDLAMAGPPLPPGCAELFADYVHDSRAGFRPIGLEPAFLTGGYLRFRHVFKEEIHAESRVYGWANRDLADAAAAGDELARFFEDLWARTASTYRDARLTASNAMQRAALRIASAAYQSAEVRVLRRCLATEDALYEELARRYARYDDPEARQWRQGDAEAAGDHGMVRQAASVRPG